MLVQYNTQSRSNFVMLCAVFGCNNCSTKTRGSISTKGRKISYHSFPKCKNLCKIWINFCKRGDRFNWEQSRICSEHFTIEDYKNYLEFEMGFTKIPLLKKNVVPSIYGNDNKETDRPKGGWKRRVKKSVDELIGDDTKRAEGFLAEKEKEIDITNGELESNVVEMLQCDEQDILENIKLEPNTSEILQCDEQNILENIKLEPNTSELLQCDYQNILENIKLEPNTSEMLQCDEQHILQSIKLEPNGTETLQIDNHTIQEDIKSEPCSTETLQCDEHNMIHENIELEYRLVYIKYE